MKLFGKKTNQYPGGTLYGWYALIGLLLSSCSVTKQISRQAANILLQDSVISTGHIGISIYEPATGQYLYNYNATKNFVPASNTKLFSLYAGLKYLGDSLVGLRYHGSGDSITIYPSADPTFLHPGFLRHPVFDFLAGKKYFTYSTQSFTAALGQGWGWDDYQEDYMVQRSEFPMYGNLIRIYGSGSAYYSIPANLYLDIDTSIEKYNDTIGFSAGRPWDENKISLKPNYLKIKKNDTIRLPLFAGLYDMPRFLMDTLHNKMNFEQSKFKNTDPRLAVIHSQPTDSLLKPMMQNSDNFFAEQTLLMASNELLGLMSDQKMIDTLLNTDLRDIPQKPQWADGSGLSRYNLFTPQSFVYILNKMKNEFGLDRLKNILPTGGQGTLGSYYKKHAGYIFAKTGTLNNHCALSGFIITKKNKLFIFSLLAGNYPAGATPVRRAFEKFLIGLRERY
ncbi:MAG: D-alanyl-D-alanine carboxypeptidase [Ferruginibacter sp.]